MSGNQDRLQLSVKKQILIIDDETINREILGAVLKDEYDTIFAADGQEAMEQIRSRNYTASVEGLGEAPILVAITYDKDDKTKPHHCLIE